MSVVEICLIIITVCLVFISLFLIGVLFSVYKLSFKTMEVMSTVEGKVSVIADNANSLITDSKRTVGEVEQILVETKEMAQKIKGVTEGAKIAKKAMDIFAMYKNKK